VILPPATLGILGNGQLGRMTALAARAMGYHVAVFPNGRQSPAGQVADREFSEAQVVTYEFENMEPVDVPVSVRPSYEVLRTAQNRVREKTWLRDHGIPVAPFTVIEKAEDLDKGDYPGVLKTAGFGYDGKGQHKVANAAEARSVWSGEPCVLESWIDFRREVSVVAARGIDGNFAHFGVIENEHRNHILDVSKAPVDGADQAIAIAQRILEGLDVIGLLCVEFFQLRDGSLVVNELAPRPHNSGHLTIEACVTSQFEQHVRSVCGLPLGSTQYLKPAAMANLLGDVWENGDPDWTAALTDSRVKLHLYGKAEPRRGRKMGHLTALADSPDQAAEAVIQARERLQRRRA
jgi:5-(carboxyamino)imidazole ribonucleotide synthase